MGSLFNKKAFIMNKYTIQNWLHFHDGIRTVEKMVSFLDWKSTDDDLMCYSFQSSCLYDCE